MKKQFYKTWTSLPFIFLAGTFAFMDPAFSQTGGAQFEYGPLMNKARIYPISTLIDDNKVVLFGGREVGFVSCMYTDVYDPELNVFTEYEMDYPFDAGYALLLSDGRYMLMGGGTDLGIPAYNNTSIFDPEEFTFSPAANMLSPRMQVSAAQLNNGKVLVVGAWYDGAAAGYAEIYNPSSNTFEATGTLIIPRASAIVLPTSDGGAVVCGGWPSFGGTTYLNVEYYNEDTGLFETYLDDPIPSDPGWMISFLTKPSADYRMEDGNYLLLAYRSSPESEYGLLSFNPSTKSFEVLTTFPLGSIITDGGFYDMTLDREHNTVYLLGAFAETDPPEVGLVTVDLDEEITYFPDDSYQMPIGEYLYPVMTYMPDYSKILLVGISSQGGSYFYGTDKTYLLTPDYVSGLNNASADVAAITIFPNPVVDQFRVSLQLNDPGKYTATLSTLNGQLVWGEIMSVSIPGPVEWIFSDISLPSGLYQLTVGGEKFNAAVPLIISK